MGKTLLSDGLLSESCAAAVEGQTVFENRVSKDGVGCTAVGAKNAFKMPSGEHLWKKSIPSSRPWIR